MEIIQRTIDECQTYAKSKDYTSVLREYLFEPLSTNDEEKRTMLAAPIYYLFDGHINNNIGSSSSKRNNIMNKLKLSNELLNINNLNYIDLSIESHATILYVFTHNTRTYLYYSNSGYGVTNNHILLNGMVAPKIYFVNERVEHLFLAINIQTVIKNCLELILKINYMIFDIKYQDSLYDEFCEKTNVLFGRLRKEHNKTQVIDFFKKVSEKTNDINVVYTLLNYFVNKLSKYVIECSFNHVITGHDNPQFTHLIKQLTSTDNILTLFENCSNDVNKDIHSKLLLIKDTNTASEDYRKLVHLNVFITNINLELDKYKHIKSIDFRLKHFKLGHNFICGIFNKLQESGSCTFFSYYNMGINMLLLKCYNESSNVNLFVTNFIKFHYCMIYLFCVSNDIKYLNSQSNYTEYNLINYSYLYKIINDNNMLDELIQFYPHKDTFLLSTKKPIIDYLLDFKASDNAQVVGRIATYSNIPIFKNLVEYLNMIIYQIRTSEIYRNGQTDKNNILSIYTSLSTIFDSIYSYYKSASCIPFIKELIDTLKFNINNDNFYSVKLSFFINLVHLYESYKEQYFDPPIQSRGMGKIKFIYTHHLWTESMGLQNNCISKINDGHNNNLIIYFLTFEELNRLSTNIEKISINDIKEKYSLEPNIFSFCNYIYKEQFLVFSKNEIIPNLFIHMLHRFDKNINMFMSEIYILFDTFIKCKLIIKNEHIADNIKISYKSKLAQIINNAKQLINIDSTMPFDNYLQSILLLILILSDGKYIINLTTPCFTLKISALLMLYYSICPKTSKLYYIPRELVTLDSLNKIKQYLINNINNINKSFDITPIISIFGAIYDTIEWIGKLKFTGMPQMIMYNSQKYDIISLNNTTSFFKVILSRFGIFTDYNSSNYLILSNKSKTQFFILIHKTQKCIEINFKNQMVDIENCYIFDETTKDTKSKLIFNLNQKDHPFLAIIPQTAPYLCYKKNNTYYVDFIISSSLKKPEGEMFDKTFKKKNMRKLKKKI